jgi:mono/diheme cytochrome c family protein
LAQAHSDCKPRSFSANFIEPLPGFWRLNDRTAEHKNNFTHKTDMNLNQLALAVLAATFSFAAVASAEDAKLPPVSTKTGVTYETDIKPIFTASCVKCHDSTKKPKAHLALDSLEGVLKGSKDGKVITPGDSTKGDLIHSIAHLGDDPMTFMPKGKGAKKLSDEQIGLIRAWIDQGAK